MQRNVVSDGQLAGLGVSIYSQDELEAGVIKQLDEEAARQNTQQQRKFAEKEIRNVQIKIRRVCYVMWAPLFRLHYCLTRMHSWVQFIK